MLAEVDTILCFRTGFYMEEKKRETLTSSLAWCSDSVDCFTVIAYDFEGCLIGHLHHGLVGNCKEAHPLVTVRVFLAVSFAASLQVLHDILPLRFALMVPD